MPASPRPDRPLQVIEADRGAIRDSPPPVRIAGTPASRTLNSFHAGLCGTRPICAGRTASITSTSRCRATRALSRPRSRNGSGTPARGRRRSAATLRQRSPDAEFCGVPGKGTECAHAASRGSSPARPVRHMPSAHAVRRRCVLDDFDIETNPTGWRSLRTATSNALPRGSKALRTARCRPRRTRPRRHSARGCPCARPRRRAGARGLGDPALVAAHTGRCGSASGQSAPAGELGIGHVGVEGRRGIGHARGTGR